MGSEKPETCVTCFAVRRDSLTFQKQYAKEVPVARGKASRNTKIRIMNTSSIVHTLKDNDDRPPVRDVFKNID